MKNNNLFQSEKLNGFIEGLAARFDIPEDFPYLNRGEEISALLQKITSNFSLQKVDSFASTLTGREMENLLLALFESGENKPTPEQATILLAILERRISNRLIKIIWQLYQCRYQEINPNIQPILAIVKDFVEREGSLGNESVLLTKLNEEDGKEQIVQMLNEQEVPINSFRKAYKFNMKSPMLWSIVRRFLEQCEKARFHFNEAWMLRILDYNEPENLTRLITNYLEKNSIEEYIDEINLKLLEKMGYPYSSDSWKDIPDKLKKKFSDWNSSRLLSIHLKGKSNKKYKLLSSYLKNIKEIYPIRNGEVLIIDFGEFVIADDEKILEYSYLIEKSRFEQIREGLESTSIRSFIDEKESVPDARGFILEESESSVMQLNYREVGKLYIKKTLDIMLGKELDMRASKSILKKAKISFKDNVL